MSVDAAAVRDDVRTAVRALTRGGMIVLTERAPEGVAGFLVAAAQTITATQMAAMLRDARGMPWLALPDARCRALELRPVHDGDTRRTFMVSIEAREGTTTGVSAAERARTMRVAAHPASTAGDVVQPGHVMPLRARPPSARERPGVVEAAVELAALAGHPGGAAMCQLLDDDGEPAREDRVAAFAAAHELPLVDQLDVLDHLLPERRLVTRLGVREEVAIGRHVVRAVTYLDRFYGVRHLALACGDLGGPAAPTVRVHVQEPLRDVFDDAGRAALLAALDAVADAAPGVLLYLARTDQSPGRPAASEGARRHEALLARRRQPYVAAQILDDLAGR